MELILLQLLNEELCSCYAVYGVESPHHDCNISHSKRCRNLRVQVLPVVRHVSLLHRMALDAAVSHPGCPPTRLPHLYKHSKTHSRIRANLCPKSIEIIHVTLRPSSATLLLSVQFKAVLRSQHLHNCLPEC